MQSETPKQKRGTGLLVGGSIVAVVAASCSLPAASAIWQYVDEARHDGYY